MTTNLFRGERRLVFAPNQLCVWFITLISFIKLVVLDESFDARIVSTLCRFYYSAKPIGNSFRNMSCSFAVPLQ